MTFLTLYFSHAEMGRVYPFVRCFEGPYFPHCSCNRLLKKKNNITFRLYSMLINRNLSIPRFMFLVWRLFLFSLHLKMTFSQQMWMLTDFCNPKQLRTKFPMSAKHHVTNPLSRPLPSKQTLHSLNLRFSPLLRPLSLLPLRLLPPLLC
jgi:hypothetical protein